MEKEFEISGCVSVPETISSDEFEGKFLEFISSNNWLFGGGINKIIDGYYINQDGSKGKHVLDNITKIK